MATRVSESRASGTVTVRVDRATHARMAQIAEAEGCSLTELAARAVDLYWRDWVFAQGNAAYAALRADPIANAEWQAEMDPARKTKPGSAGEDARAPKSGLCGYAARAAALRSAISSASTTSSTGMKVSSLRSSSGISSRSRSLRRGKMMVRMPAR